MDAALGGAQVHAHHRVFRAAAAEHVEVPPVDPLPAQGHQPDAVQPFVFPEGVDNVAEQGG